MRQLISEAIDAHLKLLRFEELLLTGEFQIYPYGDKVINRLVLTLLGFRQFCHAYTPVGTVEVFVKPSHKTLYPNQGFTQEAACYIIQRHLLRVIAQIVEDIMLHS